VKKENVISSLIKGESTSIRGLVLKLEDFNICIKDNP